jgi:hypothetical protein
METEVSYCTEIFNAELQANAPRMGRCMEDMAFYWAIRNGQYTNSAIQTLTQQGRPILTFDLIGKHVDTEAGMLMQKPYEFHYETEFGQKDHHAYLANEIRLRDKDLGKWMRQKTWFLIDGLINHGVMELFVDYSSPSLPTGFLNFRRRFATDYLFQHDWKTDDINDNKQIFEFQYMDPESMLWTYGNTAEKLEEIQLHLEIWKRDRAAGKQPIHRGPGYMPFEKNGKFLAIQSMEMPRVRKSKLFNPMTGAFLDLDFKDRTQKDAYLRLAAMEGEQLRELPVTVRECRVKAFAPGLSMTTKLADGPHRLQVGRYPLVVWSPYRTEDGERFGRVAKYKDPQQVYNKKIATFLHWQMTAANGVTFINPGAFDDDTEERRYIQEHNIPGSVFRTLDSDKIKKEDPAKPPEHLLTLKDDALEFMNYVGASPAAQGKSEGASEPGILYDAKREQSAIGMEHLNQGLEHAELELGEMYITAAPQFYRGKPMVFKSRSTKEQTDVFVNTDASNDISQVGRLGVRVTQAPVGSSLKRENLSIMARLRQAAKDPVESSALAIQIVKLLPDMAEEERTALQGDLEKVHLRNVLTTDLQIITLQGQIAQAQAMMMPTLQPGNPAISPALPPIPDADFRAVPGNPGAGGEVPATGSEQPVGELSGG